MEPEEHVEINPAQHNCADNTGLECCWSTKTRYIYSVYSIHGEVTIVGETRGDEIFVTTESFPIRIGPWELS